MRHTKDEINWCLGCCVYQWPKHVSAPIFIPATHHTRSLFFIEQPTKTNRMCNWSTCLVAVST
jgi:hypothetical protein